jgi:tRNA(Ile)-lysidine synthase
MGIHPVEAKVLGFMKEQGFSKGDPLLCAFSGGVDSTALLCALRRLGFENIRAIHVVHGIRPEGELEAEELLVRQTCSSLGVGLSLAHIRPGAIVDLAASSGSGVEAAARDYRYHIFLHTALKFGSKAICVAHNSDDQLETILGRFLGGSGLDGLCGIPDRRPISKSNGISWIVRPLLTTSRQEIEDYIKLMELRYSTDSTNSSDDYRRNRVRHHLVPMLDKMLPGWRTSVFHTSQKLALDAESMAQAEKEVLKHLRFSEYPRMAEINALAFFAASRAVQIRVLVKSFAWVLDRRRMGALRLIPALNQMLDGKKKANYSNATISLVGKDVVVRHALDFPLEESYFFTVPRTGKYRIGYLVLDAEWFGSYSTRDDANVQNMIEKAEGASLLEASFEFPLIVRTRRPGDTIDTKMGKVRLDDILKSMSVTAEIRNRIPIVEDRKGIVAVMPGSFDFSVAIPPKFRTFEGGNTGRRLLVSVKGDQNSHVR